MNDTSLFNKIESSHQAIAKTISGFGSDLKQVAETVNEMKLNVALLTDHYGQIVDQNKIRNGRIEKCEEKISEIDWSKTVKALGLFAPITIALIAWIWSGQVKAVDNVDASMRTLDTKITEHISASILTDMDIKKIAQMVSNELKKK